MSDSPILTPQKPVRLEPATAEERRNHALLQAAATIYAGPNSPERSWAVKVARRMLEAIEAGEPDQ